MRVSDCMKRFDTLQKLKPRPGSTYRAARRNAAKATFQDMKKAK